MIKFIYKNIHDHYCDNCNVMIRDSCVKNCNEYLDELCDVCKELYRQFLKRENKFK